MTPRRRGDRVIDFGRLVEEEVRDDPSIPPALKRAIVERARSMRVEPAGRQQPATRKPGLGIPAR